MKKFTSILIGLCLFTSIPTLAQFDYGIKAGVNFSNKPTNISGIKDGHTGWYAGPMAKVIIPVIGLGFEANALYSNSGASINGETFNKNSIEIPLYLRYELRLPAIRKIITPFIAVGPQWGYTFGKREFGNIKNWEDAIEISDRYFKFNKSCFSLNTGLGIILLNHVQIHVNYNIALGETCEYIGTDNFKLNNKIEPVSSRSNIWQLSLAYLF